MILKTTSLKLNFMLQTDKLLKCWEKVSKLNLLFGVPQKSQTLARSWSPNCRQNLRSFWDTTYNKCRLNTFHQH